MRKSDVNPVPGSGLWSRSSSNSNQFRPGSHGYRPIKFHLNLSIASSDIPLKCKNPV